MNTLRTFSHGSTVAMYRADTSEPRLEDAVLELAILGLLQENPMHGYELRKELATKLGTIRAAISYGVSGHAVTF